MTSRHYGEQGDYWPVSGRGKAQRPQRYGVLQLEGYAIASAHHNTHPRPYTSFHVCDLADSARVVKTFGSRGEPGEYRVQRKRELACEYADDLNFLDREHDRAQARTAA